MGLKVKREEMLKRICERRGYFTLQDICNLHNYIYNNRYDREKATQKITTLEDIGMAKRIQGSDLPRKYEFVAVSV